MVMGCVGLIYIKMYVNSNLYALFLLVVLAICLFWLLQKSYIIYLRN